MIIPLDVPIACNLTEDALVARRQPILTDLTPKVESQQELTDGYAFSFPNEDKTLQKIMDFILVEQQCCPFFQIELVLKPNNGSVWLNLRGGDGVKQFVETELGSFTGQQNQVIGSR